MKLTNPRLLALYKYIPCLTSIQKIWSSYLLLLLYVIVYLWRIKVHQVEPQMHTTHFPNCYRYKGVRPPAWNVVLISGMGNRKCAEAVRQPGGLSQRENLHRLWPAVLNAWLSVLLHPFVSTVHEQLDNWCHKGFPSATFRSAQTHNVKGGDTSQVWLNVEKMKKGLWGHYNIGKHKIKHCKTEHRV